MAPGEPAPVCVVVGDLCVDVAARLHEPLALGSDAAASISLGGGGSAANVAAWLASAGVATVLVGRVGDDEPGRRERDRLERLGVRTRLARDPQTATGTVIAVVGADGERTMLTDRGASAWLSAEDLPADAFATADHLHLSGYTLLHETSRQGGLEALRLARQAGLTVSVDPSSHAPLRAVGRERFLSWTQDTELCLLNADEARVLAGTEELDVALERLAATYREVVVTLGGHGARWRGAQGSALVHAGAAAVRDTTGAGDAFRAGFLAVWLTGGSPRVALSGGADLAARAVETVGARPQ